MKFLTYFIIISINWFLIYIFLIFKITNIRLQFSLEIKEIAKLIYWSRFL